MTTFLTRKKGDIVAIRNSTLSGREIVEGDAVLVKRISGDEDGERWLVRFDGVGPTYERWIAS